MNLRKRKELTYIYPTDGRCPLDGVYIWPIDRRERCSAISVLGGSFELVA
jgi:hypothetical protein